MPQKHTNNRRPSKPGRTPIKRSGNQHAIPIKRKRRSNILPRAILVFGGFTAVIALAFLTFGNSGSLASSSDSTAANSSTATPTATPESAAVVAPLETATPTPTEDPTLLAEILLAQDMLDDPYMILVSVDSVMPDGYVVNEVLADSNTGKTLAATAAYAYIDMAAAAKTDGITIQLQSAYRSVSYQEGLFEKQIEKWIGWGYSEAEATVQAATVVNPPGASEHNCGLAADINCPDFWALEEGFEDTTAFAWLDEHAVEYGYILRYPKGDEAKAITGITYEPWHWRYVGVENAAIIKESGLCFETFLIELAAIADGTSTSDVITGTVAWQAAVGTADFSSSGSTATMTYQEAVDAGLDPEALGITP